MGLAHLQERTLACCFFDSRWCFQGRLGENVDSLALAVTRGRSAENGIRVNKKQTTNRRSNRVSVTLCASALQRRTHPATAADLWRPHAGLKHHFNLRFSCRMRCGDVYVLIQRLGFYPSCSSSLGPVCVECKNLKEVVHPKLILLQLVCQDLATLSAMHPM